MIFLYIALAVLSVLLVVLFILGHHIFKNVCLRRTERPNTFEALFSTKDTADMPQEEIKKQFLSFEGMEQKEISVMSYDGLRLCGTVVYAPHGITPRGIVLLFHGYRSIGRRDFCLQIPMLHEAGYHIIVADQRSHGKSEGKYICYGIKERFDVVCWKEKATEIFGKQLPIALMGLSMGGATVLMASGLISQTDKNVKCVVADCPFSSPWDTVAHVMRTRHKAPSFPLLFFINFWCITIAKINLRKYSSAKAVANTSLPYLLFHGLPDDYVTFNHSKEILAAANGRAELCVYENARHSESVFCDPQRYKSELLGFLDKHMKF